MAIDFSVIGEWPQVYNAAKIQSARQQALSGLTGPESVNDVSRKLFAAGDIEGGLSLAKLGDAQAMRDWMKQRDERDFAFRGDESERAQRNSDRAFNLQQRQFDVSVEGSKVPPGFRATPQGALQPVPGGPSDPAYIHAATEARDKGKQFTANEITKLVDDGGKYSNLANFSSTFQDRYAGYRVPAVGNVAMTAGRYLPSSMVSKDMAEGAAWWQNYDRYKNVVRNELFGAALTANEQAAFERADIGPGMDPAQIRANLTAQQSIIKNAMVRKAGALIAGGYQPEPIARAFGLDLKELGVNTTRRGAPPSPTSPPTSPDTPTSRKPSDAAVKMLRADPALAEQFDEWYGVGSAARALGVLR